MGKIVFNFEKYKMKNTFITFFAFALIFIVSPQANAQCDIPCGIYNDSLRFVLLIEHIDIMEKAMEEIEQHSAISNPDYNQIVRWVNAKEAHGDAIQKIVTSYFLTDRVAIVPATHLYHEDYLFKLQLIHEICLAVNAAKQSTNKTDIVKLREIVAAFQLAYYVKHEE